MPSLGSSRFHYLADAADIVHWSDRTEARTEFPRLIRRLVLQNNDQIVRLEMRAAEGVGVAGYDGTIEASRATTLVPDGLSYWELGVGANPGSKADEDYKKRTEKLGEGVKSDATFVFVTSRRWPGMTQWEANKRAEDRWRNVRAFDVDDVEQALEQAPSVHVWFSELVGKRLSGVQSLDDWWRNYLEQSTLPLSPEMVLAGREDRAAELIGLLAENRQFLSVGGPSEDDDLAFIAAAILASSDELQMSLLSRTLIARAPEVFRSLDGTRPLLLLVPSTPELVREAKLARDHNVVVLSDQDSPVDLGLAEIDQDKFAQALIDAGVAADEAKHLGFGAHRSLKRYQRLASRGGSGQSPEWGGQARSGIIRRAWLAGGWQSDSSGDVDVLSGLFGRQYQEAVNELWPAGRGADPLFTHVGSVWAVGSPEESWAYVRSQITSSDLNALETAIQSVLGAVDPALELPAEDRWKASIYGKSRIHSITLRKGLATTLAIFGAQGHAINLGSGITGREWAESVIYQLLDRANGDETGHLWSSLSDVLSLLVEAAPEAFLRAVQVGVTGGEPILQKLFIDQYEGFSISSPHTGLLWSLESLAWSSTHFGLVVDHLARLAEIDPGGRLSNRPSNSLVGLFRPWNPQTSANYAARLVALKSLVSRHPEVALDLLLSLLPNRDVWGPLHQGPRFRPWKPQEQGVTHKEYWDFSSSVARMILELTEKESLRWVKVVEHLPNFPLPERVIAIDQSKQLATDTVPDATRLAIWEAFDTLVRHHRSFPEASWVLPQSELEQLEEVLALLRPGDPKSKHQWLFRTDTPDIGVRMSDDFDRYQEELAQLRKDAVAMIVQHGGLPELIEFLSEAPGTWYIGAAAADIDNPPNSAEVIDYLDAEDPAQVNFALGFAQRASRGELKFLLPLVESLGGRPRAQARLLAVSDKFPEVWLEAARLGSEVERIYWREFRIHGRGADYAYVNESARRLIDHGRPVAALDLMCLYRDKRNDPIDPQFVVDAFNQFFMDGDEEIKRLSSWEIERLLDYLRESRIDEDAIALLEWQLLPALGLESSGRILQRRLARAPSFFVEILSLCFKPASGDEQTGVRPEVVQNAFRLLLDWKHIPGSDEIGGQVNAGELRAWYGEARTQLLEADRLSIGEEYIGKVLAWSYTDSDGAWPAIPIRELIEEAASIHLDDGVVTGVRNSRGITSRELDEGGDQEYALADQYDAWAESTTHHWPRTASILRTIATQYRLEARTHDEEARRFKEGLDR